jgi:hypothetical protein
LSGALRPSLNVPSSSASATGMFLKSSTHLFRHFSLFFSLKRKTVKTKKNSFHYLWIFNSFLF